MSDTDSAEAGQHSRLAIDRRRPPPLISRDTTQFAQPAVLPVANQQLPPGYLVVPQGGPQIFQGPDGTLYAIHPPGSIQGAVQVKSPIEAAIQNSRTSPSLGTITSSALANDSSQHLPLVPIFAPIQVGPSVAKKYQQMFQLPSTSRTERVVTSPQASPRQVSPLEINAPTQVRYTGTSSLSGESLQSHVVVSPHSIYSTVQGETPSLTSSEKNPRVLLSPANYHVQSPTVNSFMEGLSTVQRASILQQHRRSLHIHEKETQEFVVEGDSSGTSSTSSRHTNLMQKDTKTESSSLKKLLQSEPESEMILSSSSASHRSESCIDTTLTLLKNEPYLVRFYQFFQSSEQSKHLRMRVLTTEGSASILKWIEVTRKASHIDPNLGPLDAVRILISSNGLCKLQVLFPYCKTLFTRFMPSSLVQANELFIELSPRHVLCPGIPDCESKISALGYQPGSVRMIETPSVRRFDHEKCPLWHIPLPCNLYSESGQIMHHMCRQCKNLYNTLTRTVAKMSQFATTEHLSTGSSGMSFAHGSTKEGRLKPSKEKRQKRMASHGSTAAGTCVCVCVCVCLSRDIAYVQAFVVLFKDNSIVRIKLELVFNYTHLAFVVPFTNNIKLLGISV